MKRKTVAELVRDNEMRILRNKKMKEEYEKRLTMMKENANYWKRKYSKNIISSLKQKEIDVKDNGPQIMKKRTYVGFLVLTPFTNYYLGLLLSSFNVMDSFDQNIYGMIPIIISFIIPYLSIALFFIYQHFFKKYKFQIIALLSLIGFTVIIYTYILIALLINPSSWK